MPFLTARWSNLCLLTYAVPPAVLQPRVPPGLVLDTRTDLAACDGSPADAGNPAAFVSLVAFDFLDTRVLGVPWPGYRDFPEINLRFYVRDPSTGDRGVCFVREFVPQTLVAFLARSIYGEPYLAAPMTSRVTETPDRITIEHALTFGGRTNRLTVVGGKPCATPADTSVEHFFKEHKWGFSDGGRPGRCVRYEVSHPVWATYAVDRHELDWDWSAVYGPEFAFLQNATPCSVVVAQGSAIAVYPKGKRAVNVDK
ncbi:MAG TPA: DUF2071 domain-containing protein [Humisphaera sp.]